jgi:hypothetical protein
MVEDTMSLQSGFSNITLGAADFAASNSGTPLKSAGPGFSSRTEDSGGVQKEAEKEKGEEEEEEEEDGDVWRGSVDSQQRSSRPSDLMISHESNKVLSQQLDQSQRRLRQEQQRVAGLEASALELSQQVGQLRAEALRLEALAGASDCHKDREVASLAAENRRLAEKLLLAPEGSGGERGGSGGREDGLLGLAQEQEQELQAELEQLRERDAEQRHAISILQATQRYAESQLGSRQEELVLVKRRLQVYAEKVASMELEAAGAGAGGSIRPSNSCECLSACLSVISSL